MRKSPLIRPGIVLPPEPPAGQALYDLVRCPLCMTIAAFPEELADRTCPSCGFDNPAPECNYENFGKRTRGEIRAEFREETVYGVDECFDGTLVMELGEVGAKEPRRNSNR